MLISPVGSESNNKSRHLNILYFLTIITSLIALISIVNYLVLRRTNINVKANLEGKNYASGMIGTIDSRFNQFTMLLEKTIDPAINKSNLIRLTVVLPNQNKSIFPDNDESPVCFRTSRLNNFDRAIAVSCRQVIQTGRHISVFYETNNYEQGVIRAKAIIGEFR
jgi:hypothetical protein